MSHICDCCADRYPKLNIEEVMVDYDASEGCPKARFTLGKDFKNRKIGVVATIYQGVDSSEQVFNLCTDCCGKFKFPIPLHTSRIVLCVQIKLNSGCHWKCKKHPSCIKVGGSYVQYDYFELDWRSYDGSANNLSHPDWGKINTALLRKADSAYADGISSLATRGPNNPNPRVVSNNICKNIGDIPNSLRLTDMCWIWGQFLDHEIDLTESGAETADIVTPSVTEDPEEEYPGRTISFHRSVSVPLSSPREQPNQISSYVDATNVYGYDTERGYALRRLDGTGKLTTTFADNGEELLPYNLIGMPNASPPPLAPEDYFLAGDIRANENIHLTAMHTLFVREHNRCCDQIIVERPELVGKDELICQLARRMVIGVMQVITYNEFLPALLGDDFVPEYTHYKNDVNPGTATEFSTVGYRLGHSMLSSSLRVGPGIGDNLLLRNGFFNPAYLRTHGADNLIIGGTRQMMQEIDVHIVDDVRNFLFGPPTATHLLDLASLNIQRARDHGIPGYNDVREGCGLTRKQTFAEITNDVTLQNKLESLYGHPDHIDPWVGALAENRIQTKAVGELLAVIIRDQFVRTRDGDRYWYEIDPALTEEMKEEIRNTKLSDVIIRNTKWTSNDIREDVFHI